MAGVGSLAATGAPTGGPVVDAVYRVGFAVAVTVAAAYAPRWSWVLAGTIVTVVAVGALDAFVIGGVALAIGCYAIVRDRRDWVHGATAGALISQAALRLPDGPFFGASALCAGAAAAVILVTGVPNLRHRRRVVAVTAGLALVGAVATALAGLTVLSVLPEAERATTAASSGLASLSDGAEAPAQSSFEEARSGFADAAARLGAPWLLPARLVPVVGQHVRAVTTVAEEGEALATEAVDAGAILRGRRYLDGAGGFDLAALEALEPEARRVAAVMRRGLDRIASVASPWLVTPASKRIEEARARIDSTLPTVEIAAEALRVGPTLLGRDGPQEYLVIVANPAEARELGGLGSSFAVLRTDQGSLEFDQSESRLDLRAKLRAERPALDSDLPASMLALRPVSFPENWTSSPDFGAVTQLAVELWESVHPDRDLAGVVYLDPHVLAALLELSGPVRLPDRDITIDADNAVDFLLRDQYAAFDEGELGDVRDVALGDVADVVFERLTDEVPDPAALAAVLGPLVEGRHLLFQPETVAAAPLLDMTGLDGVHRSGPGDVAVTLSNTRANKLDAYLQRTIEHEVLVGDDLVTHTVSVTLANQAPEGLNPYVTGTGDFPDGLPELTNRTVLALHAPWPAVAVSIDGRAVGTGTSPALGSQWRHAVSVTLDGGTTMEVRFVAEVPREDAPAVLRLVPTATAVPDRVGHRLLDAEGRLSDVPPRLAPGPVTLVLDGEAADPT